MSTKTTFKRIALVAVAALGLGVLSVAPSSAAVGQLAVTVTNGTASASYSDTRTAATISVSGLIDSNSDTISVSFLAKDITANSSAVARLYWIDTLTSATGEATSVKKGFNGNAAAKTTTPSVDSVTAAVSTSTTPYTISANGASAYVGAKFGVSLDSITAPVAGTYTYTAVVKTYDAGVYKASTTADFTITVAASALVSTVVAPASTTAFIGATSGPTADAAVSAVSTNDSTVDAYIQLNIYNAAGASDKALDSVTASVSGPGLISFDGTTYGKSIKVASTGSQSIRVLADGTAGVSTISISTLSGFSTTKSVTFYAKAAKTITAAVATPVLGVGANAGAVSVTAVDANGTAWTGAAYIVASAAADALVAGSATTPVACAAWNATDGILCDVTAIAAGTAKFKVIDASTVAAATATSNEVTVTVSAATLSTVKLAFDKASYQPYEKATITVTPVDASGNLLPAASRDNVLATGGITSDISFGSLSDTLTATTIKTSSTTGVKKYTVYMPAQGTVTITATGGTALSLAGQVAITAKADVVNSSVDAATDAANEATDAANAATDAALAAADAADAATAAAQDASDAVAALSATVAKLVASLKAQITSLTNLVIKIQKKVKA
ncbi:hypothetical protein [Candidatus Planktophila dulcis]|uniref:hypothetical protein n=1 Tax=Candidatus Planktophila dulcis TaxID=1884914 RepID=UPI003CF68F00